MQQQNRKALNRWHIPDKTPPNTTSVNRDRGGTFLADQPNKYVTTRTNSWILDIVCVCVKNYGLWQLHSPGGGSGVDLVHLRCQQ